MINKEKLKFIFALKLKDLRTNRGLSLKELAQKSQVSLSYINEIEKAKKYPMPDKISSLAHALGVSYDELVSTNVDSKLIPVVEFYASNIFDRLPLNEFGISDTDLFNLTSYAPEKFSSFLMTMTELMRTYDMGLSNINQAALRAYIESHNNFFIDIEQQVENFKEKYNLDNMPSYNHLLDILKNNHYTVDEISLNSYDELKELRYLSKSLPTKKLFVNPKLSQNQKTVILAQELAYAHLGLDRSENLNCETSSNSFKDLLNEFKSNYFAGSLLLDIEIFKHHIHMIFKNPTFDKNIFSKIIGSLNCSSEVFFYRLTQVLPKFFGLENIFFLKSTHNTKEDVFQITKELHLSKLHKPHASKLNEQYCRRWITISLLKDLKGPTDDFLVSAQKSIMLGSNEKYLCISLAKPSALKKNTNNCLTIGILINDHSKALINFLEDPAIPIKDVGQTCERCALINCTDRAAKPTIYKEIEKGKELKLLLNRIGRKL